MQKQPEEPEYVPVDEGGQEVEPVPTPMRDLVGAMGLIGDGTQGLGSFLCPPEGLPEAGGIVFADLIPEYDADGRLTMQVGRVSVTARDVTPDRALGNFLLTLASLEEQGIEIKFNQAPMKAPSRNASAPSAPVTPPTQPKATPAPAQASAGQSQALTSEGVHLATMTKLVIEPVVGDKFVLKCFEKAGFQWEFLKSYPMTRSNAIKHLNDANFDGDAMVKVVTDQPMAFIESNGFGLAWKDGAPKKTKPQERYRNFVGLYDLNVGWV